VATGFADAAVAFRVLRAARALFRERTGVGHQSWVMPDNVTAFERKAAERLLMNL
jgi:hypothetical protein